MVPTDHGRLTVEPGIPGRRSRRLSYEYIASQLASVSPRLAAGRVIVAHLGAGASLCALMAGRSIETTMGFSTLDGLVMAARCGSLDPAVILHLGRQGHSFSDIEDMLYRRSGLLGVSGISDDVRVLLASESLAAREAPELLSYRVAAQAGVLASALGDLDGLVFTAGIGEHAAPVRAAVCARLAWLGVRLDGTANAGGAGLISRTDSAVEVRVIATDEEAMIARHTRATLRENPAWRRANRQASPQGRRSAGDPAVHNFDDTVAPSCRIEVVGDHREGGATPPVHLSHEFEDSVRRLRIKAARRLVGKHEIRFLASAR